MTIVLRAFRDDDADAELLFRLNSDEDALRVVPRRVHRSIDESRALLAKFLAQRGSAAARDWVIERDGSALGVIGLSHIDRASRRAQIGYALERDHWGRGIAREAVLAVLRVAFGELGLERVEAHVDAENRRSLRFAEKMGLVLERSFGESVDGAPRTTHVYVVRVDFL